MFITTEEETLAAFQHHHTGACRTIATTMLLQTLRTITKAAPLCGSPIAASAAVRTFASTSRAYKVYENVSAADFQSRVLSPSGADAETPVLVDFFATWCQPCKLLSPALKKVASNPDVVGGKHIDLVTIDVDQHQDIAQQFKVSAMPTVIAMKGGKVSTQSLNNLDQCQSRSTNNISITGLRIRRRFNPDRSSMVS